MKRGTKRKAAARTAAPKRGPARRLRRTGAKKAAAKRREPGKGTTLLAAAAIARATGRAQASVRTELSRKGLAERMTEAALHEAEEIGMLLDEDGESAEDEDDSGEADYFLKPQPVGPRRPRVRPAPGIEGGSPPTAPRLRDAAKAGRGAAKAKPAKAGSRVAAGSAKGAGAAGSRGTVGRLAPPLPRGGEHLFPRNLRLTYPVAVKAEGVFIEDADGRRYLDGCGGAVVCSIGHGVKEIAEVMTAQARRLAFAHSSQFVTREAMDLTARIAALAPGDMKETGRVYLVSGGSEAVETGLKLARQYQVESGRPGRHKIIGRWQSYHGSTLGALAVTGNQARRDLYLPMLSPSPHIAPSFCYRCPLGLEYPECAVSCIDELDTAIRQEGPDTVAAFIAEPVVGATLGAVPTVKEYFQRARAICDAHGVLLIADEVMTGVGRTGKNFGIDHYGVVPDLIVTGKGLSAGYAPLGAVIARGHVVEALARGRGHFEHGFTYSANPLSAAVGSAVLRYLEDHRLIQRAATMGKVLGRRLAELKRSHKIIGDVRGLGMLWGLELVADRASKEPFAPGLKMARRLYEASLAEGLMIYPGTGTREGRDGDHAIIAPPFTIKSSELDDLIDRLDRALGRVTRSLD
ncbi:MAG TPA: aspartate aminotransferase family protein [Candidatus Polarisedimenticolia bacterium]|nr:aspartate aminotransferase family protein [Candidatus Polarisedimenticolia bacterium]